jgi:hypothetical protein
MSVMAAGSSDFARMARAAMEAASVYSTSSGHGTMVDFTVFMAIASATA